MERSKIFSVLSYFSQLTNMPVFTQLFQVVKKEAEAENIYCKAFMPSKAEHDLDPHGKTQNRVKSDQHKTSTTIPKNNFSISKL